MFIFTYKSIFDDEFKAIVNPVNTRGVMGAGLALEFKKRYPENFNIYRKACLNKEMDIGKLCVVELDNKIIINFPTKRDYRDKSDYEYIKSGMKELSIWLKKNKPENIAIPRLGCGLGGLEWYKVKRIICDCLSNIDVDIYILGQYSG